MHTEWRSHLLTHTRTVHMCVRLMAIRIVTPDIRTLTGIHIMAFMDTLGTQATMAVIIHIAAGMVIEAATMAAMDIVGAMVMAAALERQEDLPGDMLLAGLAVVAVAVADKS